MTRREGETWLRSAQLRSSTGCSAVSCRGTPIALAEGVTPAATKYAFGRTARQAKDGIFAFSNVPLRFVLTLGFVVSARAIVETIFVIVNKLGGFDVVPDWASVAITVSFLGGIQLIVLGVIGDTSA